MLVTSGGENRFFNFLSRRFIRILPMYWLFSLLVVAAYLINNKWNVGGFSGNDAAGFQRIIFSLALLPQPASPLLVVGWTLIYEMIFYYSIAVLLLFADGKYVLPWVIFLSIIGILQYSTGTSVMNGHLLNIYFHSIFAGRCGLSLPSQHRFMSAGAANCCGGAYLSCCQPRARPRRYC